VSDSVKKPWVGPKVIDIGSVDEQTTAGVGNVGDSASDHQKQWKPSLIDIPENAKVTLPEGE
jgi:hypothetical protein